MSDLVQVLLILQAIAVAILIVWISFIQCKVDDFQYRAKDVKYHERHIAALNQKLLALCEYFGIRATKVDAHWKVEENILGDGYFEEGE